MPTPPLCHRTLGHDPHPRYLYDRSRASDAEIAKLVAAQPNDLVGLSSAPSAAAITRLSSASPCLGSACALWVPEVRYESGLSPQLVLSDSTFGRTGRGYCADNLRRAAWEDPARGQESAKDVAGGNA